MGPAMPTTNHNDPMNGFIDMLVNEIALRLMQRMGDLSSAAKPTGSAKAEKAAPAKRHSKAAGRKLDMACRAPGCKNRSKGPRFHFLCDEHLKASKEAPHAALAKPGAKGAKAKTAKAKPAAPAVAAAT